MRTLIIGLNNDKLMEKINKYYLNKNMKICNIDENTNICDIKFNNTEVYIIKKRILLNEMIYLKSFPNISYITLLSNAGLDIRQHKILYDEFFISQNLLRSGVTKLRLRFILDDKFEQLDKYKTNKITDNYIYIKQKYNIIYTEYIEIDNYDYKIINDKINIYDMSDDFNMDVTSYDLSI